MSETSANDIGYEAAMAELELILTELLFKLLLNPVSCHPITLEARVTGCDQHFPGLLFEDRHMLVGSSMKDDSR